MTNKANTQERCQYEQHVEKYFGLDPEKTTDRMEIKTDFGQFCNLLCTFADKPAIPESIEQCRLTKEEFQAVNQRALLSPLPIERAIDLTQRRLLEKFAAYLGKTAKELPSDYRAFEIEYANAHAGFKPSAKETFDEVCKYFHSRASEALRQKEKQAKEFLEWVNNEGYKMATNCKFYKPTSNVIPDYKSADELFTLFLSAPPLGEKGKECQHENTITSAGVNFCQDCNTVNPQIKK